MRPEPQNLWYEQSSGMELLSDLSQRKRWQPLDTTADFFKDCRKHPLYFIPAEDYERHYYFYQCEEIVFREENKTLIWSTTGEGHITVPKGVSISIKQGKMRSS